MNKYRSYESFDHIEEHITAFVKEQGFEEAQIKIWHKTRPSFQVNIIFYNYTGGVEDLWNLTQDLNENYPFRYGWKFSVEGSTRNRGKLRIFNQMPNPIMPCNMEVRY